MHDELGMKRVEKHTELFFIGVLALLKDQSELFFGP